MAGSGTPLPWSLYACDKISDQMKWKVRVITKRKRKQALRVKANTLEELVEKLSKHAGKILDFEIETSVNDTGYWKSLILAKLFEKTHTEDTTPLLF
jgi:hypothetical protein